MDPFSYDYGWFAVIPFLVVIFWVLAFVCLIQLIRFLTKGIKALDIYIDKNKKATDSVLADGRGIRED